MPDMEEPKAPESTSKTITRRRFILGVIAGGAVVSAASHKLLAPRSRNLFRRHAADYAQREWPATARRSDEAGDSGWTLRYKLGLTGTKLGCDRAECGACTVLLDDVPHYSCSVLTNTVRGKNVTTIEGLAAADGTLHPVQKAVVDEQGFQCAFCMSGFIMAAWDT